MITIKFCIAVTVNRAEVVECCDHQDDNKEEAGLPIEQPNTAIGQKEGKKPPPRRGFNNDKIFIAREEDDNSGVVSLCVCVVVVL